MGGKLSPAIIDGVLEGLVVGSLVGLIKGAVVGEVAGLSDGKLVVAVSVGLFVGLIVDEIDGAEVGFNAGDVLCLVGVPSVGLVVGARLEARDGPLSEFVVGEIVVAGLGLWVRGLMVEVGKCGGYGVGLMAGHSSVTQSAILLISYLFPWLKLNGVVSVPVLTITPLVGHVQKLENGPPSRFTAVIKTSSVTTLNQYPT